MREYSVQGKSYWIVTGWKNHQRIDKPTYRHPLPQSALKLIDDNSSSTNRDLADISAISPQLINDHLPATRRIVTESSGTESNGMESNRKEEDICEAEASLVDANRNSASTHVKEIFRYWQQTMNHPHAKLDPKRAGKIKHALKLGYSVEALKQAINGCARTPFNMGENDRSQRYDEITLTLRDASHIESFMQAASYSLTSNTPKSNSDVFRGVI